MLLDAVGFVCEEVCSGRFIISESLFRGCVKFLGLSLFLLSGIRLLRSRWCCRQPEEARAQPTPGFLQTPILQLQVLDGPFGNPLLA